MKPRQLTNLHKLCIVKHASKVCYMRQSNSIQPVHISHIPVKIGDIPPK